jgi:prepilin-type N-terminal cleavage/methylation domain-containing protein
MTQNSFEGKETSVWLEVLNAKKKSKKKASLTGTAPRPAKSGKGGFTLIELLAVVAIIGLMAAIVLSNMAKNRNSARDAAVKSSLQEVQKAAEFLYGKVEASYEGVCDAKDTTLSDQGDFGKIKVYIEKNNGPNGVIGCKDGGEAYAVISSLNLKDCWCVDWQGTSKEVKLEGAADCRAKLETTSCP